MSIKRSARRTNFTTLDNAVFTNGLSYRAMGLLTYLLSKPDHWQVSVANLVNVSAGSRHRDGRDSVYAILNELMEVGFIIRTLRQVEKGKLAGYDYEVFDSPQSLQLAPCTPAPDTVKPNSAEPRPADPIEVKTDIPVRTDQEQISIDPIEAGFEIFWAAGMAKAGRKKAVSIFASIVKRTREDPVVLGTKLADDVRARLKAGQFGFDKLHPTTYLNQERWNDAIAAPAGRPNNRINLQSQNYVGTPDNEISWLNPSNG